MSAAGLGRTGKRNNSFGSKRSPESKAKMRAAKLGGTLTAEHRARIGEAVQGKQHPNWKGGRRYGSDTYVLIWVATDHPFYEMANRWNGRAYIREHRLVMATHLGRPLARTEIVHHKLPCEGGSGDKRDNRIENLLLFATQSEHMAHHRALKDLQ
jgi:hypothetical protein